MCCNNAENGKRAIAPTASRNSAPTSEWRLHKYLAACGVGSRRRCEAMIAAGRVAVDGRVISTPGYKIEPGRQRVCVDRRPVVPQASVYWVVHKPRGVVTTCRDPRGRRTFLDLLPPNLPRVFPVGRLDYSSEGLLLATNDGALMQRLAHPRYGCEKRYRVWTDRPLTADARAAFVRGMVVDGVRMRMVEITPDKITGHQTPVYAIRLREGRNRQIRRMLAARGFRVLRLLRTGLGPLEIGHLPPGESRPLTAAEVEALRATVSDEKPLSRAHEDARFETPTRHCGNREFPLIARATEHRPSRQRRAMR